MSRFHSDQPRQQEVVAAWRTAYIASEKVKDATRSLLLGGTENPGIQKYSLMIQANLHHALGNVDHVIAKSIRLGDDDRGGAE